VRDIIKRDERRKQHLAELEAKYGKRPKVATLPDDTPLEVLALCDGKIQGWATRLWHLANDTFLHAPIATLGELRRASDAQLLKGGNVGKKLVEGGFARGTGPRADIRNSTRLTLSCRDADGQRECCSVGSRAVALPSRNAAFSTQHARPLYRPPASAASAARAHPYRPSR
jgi:hypothetical protein